MSINLYLSLGGYENDYGIQVEVSFDYIQNMAANTTIKEIINITNSTNGQDTQLFSLIGRDPRITYGTVGNHQYVFIVYSYNVIGYGGKQSSPQLTYGLPNSNFLLLKKGLQSNSTVLHVVWNYLSPKINSGYDDINCYELFARNNNSLGSAPVLVKNVTNTMDPRNFQFAFTVPNLSAYWFSLRVRNSFGYSNFTKELLHIAADSPKALKQVVVKTIGPNVSIEWGNSFDSKGFAFKSFDLAFYHWLPYPILLSGTQQLQVFCNMSDPGTIAQQSCIIPMFAFTEYPNFIEAGTQVNVQALGINDVGSTNFTP